MNVGDKSKPGVTVSSFFRALIAPGRQAILQGYRRGAEPGRVRVGWEQSPEEKTKDAPNQEGSAKMSEEKSRKMFPPPTPQKH